MFTEDENKELQAEIRQEVTKREKLAKDIFKKVEIASATASYADDHFTDNEEEASDEYRNLLSEVVTILDDALKTVEKLRGFDSTEEVTNLITEKFRLRKIARLN